MIIIDLELLVDYLTLRINFHNNKYNHYKELQKIHQYYILNTVKEMLNIRHIHQLVINKFIG